MLSEEFRFAFSELNERRQKEGKSYLSFLNQKTLHCGVYHLKAGTKDMQQPHSEDEVYYVVQGKSHFEVEGDTVQVGPGDILFVAAGQTHRFMDIEEDLSILVFFSRAPVS